MARLGDLGDLVRGVSYKKQEITKLLQKFS